MRSAYPSSQSFFDSTSDSIRAEDIEKCRSSASFSSLADLFTNPSSKSDLFPHTRAPVSVAEEVRFPAKKKRECEERTSIWHEWGSGECQSENVAEESSGFTSNLIRGGKSSILCPSSFPNLGSANISLLTEDFTFPARKRREEGSSWREERTSWQDWSTSVAPKRREQTRTGSSPVVGSIQDMYLSKPCTKPLDFVISSKSSPFSSLGAPVKSASEEVSFPARKKREERSFWQESSLDGSTQPDCVVVAPPRQSAPGVGSLADMYKRKAPSGLFSKGAVSGSEEVIFPKRRNNADRNAWRDWTNTGYSDYEDGEDQDGFREENSPKPIMVVVGTETGLACPAVNSPCSIEGSSRFSVSENSPLSECMSRSSVRKPGGGAVGALQSSSIQVQVCEEVSGPIKGLMCNVDESGHVDHQAERTMDGGEASDVTDDIGANVDHVQEGSFRYFTSGQRRGRSTGKYPPPLRSLSRPGQSRVPTHMPWVQLQPIRSKGRFVLQEVKVTQPVVFQPIRTGGRLVLQLIGQEKSFHIGDEVARHRGNGAVAEAKVTVTSGKGGLQESLTVKTEVKVVEKTDVSQSLDNVRREGSERRKISNVRSAEIEQRKKSAKVWPVVGTSWEALPGDGVAADMWDRKSSNVRELRYMTDEMVVSSDRCPERDRTIPSEGGLAPDRSWLLGKLSTESRTFDARKSLHSGSQFRNAVDRLGQKGNVISIPRVRESAPLRLQFQTLPRAASLRNGLSGLNCPRVEGGGNLGRSSKSIKSSSLADAAAIESGKEERTSDPVPARAQESRPSLSVYQGIIRDSFLSLATAHSFLRSLRTRPDIPGELDPRVPSCKPPVASVFSCADGVGTLHHEKNFWEQQPCVS